MGMEACAEMGGMGLVGVGSGRRRDWTLCAFWRLVFCIFAFCVLLRSQDGVVRECMVGRSRSRCEEEVGRCSCSMDRRAVTTI